MQHRMLVLAIFLITLLPIRALAVDGSYTVAVSLSGGSGRATVESPTTLTVADGEATAVVTWSSPHYAQMLVDGAAYYPVNQEGNSVFEIPVALDEEIPVRAETLAMSAPHLIDYTLYFDSSTLRPLSAGGAFPFVAAGIVVVLLLAGGILLRRRKRARQRGKGGSAG